MIEGALADSIEAEVRDLLGPVADRLQDEADRILAEAREQWPVKTGKSRDGWETVLTLQPGTWEVEVSMLNPVEHTRYIKSTKVGESDDATRVRSPMQAHVRKPALDAKKVLKRDLPELLARALEDSWRG